MSERNATMQSDEVLAFLDDHPDFLQQHAERFGLKSGADRVVVSLVDRQMLELKDRCRQLEARLHQLVGHGERNDQIQSNIHQLALTLIAADTPARLASDLRDCLDKTFGLSRCALGLWHPAAGKIEGVIAPRADVALLARNLDAPYCGPYVNDEVMSWFPPVPVLQSFCQIALRDSNGESFGLLALASDDPERFTHDMHTHYLTQIGEMVSAAWCRLLADG